MQPLEQSHHCTKHPTNSQKAPSKELTTQMFATVTKGQDIPDPAIMPEELADAITGTIANVDGVNHIR